jgi:precorrin-2 methylase
MSANTARTPNSFDIYIVGTGIRPIAHLTNEAMNCLRASNRVFLVDHGFGTAQEISNQGIPVESLLPLYVEGRTRIEIYREMAARILAAALDFGPVAFATYGHPCFHVYPTQLIRKAAPALGLRVYVAPGISILDTLMVELNLDPGASGLQIYDASDCVQERRILQPDVPLILIQVETLNLARFTYVRQEAEGFLGLQEHLLKFYKPEHEVVAITSSTHPLIEPTVLRFSLSDLISRYTEDWRSGTLYLPPASGVA